MRIPALIIGGGPAGSAAAITLAQAGMQPHLLERHKAPRDCVCGSFIGWDALAALSNLGVDPWA
ncbi:MAG TPA: FAD-dependent monooxygenase, partial [Sphingobium sp.]